MHPTRITRSYDINYEQPEEPPFISYPISAKTLPEGCLWIWKPFVPFSESVLNDKQFVTTNDYVEQPGDNLTMVSDATVHVDTSKVSDAWQLYKEQDNKR